MFQVMPPQGGIGFSFFRSFLAESFKSCPRKGASATHWHQSAAFHLFQVMPPQGGIVMELIVLAIVSRFQVMPPQGGIKRYLPSCTTVFMFQVMPPQGGISSARAKMWLSCTFQVMPPQGGIQKVFRVLCKSHVSSHAPARGHRRKTVIISLAILFQVMPPQGGIYVGNICTTIVSGFKSCPRKGASYTS